MGTLFLPGASTCPTGYEPIPRDTSACEAAAESLGLGYDGMGEWDHLPSGCVANITAHNQVVFNSLPHGAASDSYTLVCQQVHVQPLYELAGPGASTCAAGCMPILSDASVCEVATLSMGLKYEGSQELDYIPSGCVKYYADNRVWFNSKPNGTFTEVYRLVCQQAHVGPTTLGTETPSYISSSYNHASPDQAVTP